jgi:hypothetical protein
VIKGLLILQSYHHLLRHRIVAKHCTKKSGDLWLLEFIKHGEPTFEYIESVETIEELIERKLGPKDFDRVLPAMSEITV